MVVVSVSDDRFISCGVMAWSGTLNEHEAFKQAGEQEIFKQACPPWELKIWEVTDGEYYHQGGFGDGDVKCLGGC